MSVSPLSLCVLFPSSLSELYQPHYLLGVWFFLSELWPQEPLMQSPKRLNSRQARWTLFFNRFDFTITYRPSSQNRCSLWWQFASGNSTSAPEAIMGPERVEGVFTREVERTVRVAQWLHPDPGNGTTQMYIHPWVCLFPGFTVGTLLPVHLSPQNEQVQFSHSSLLLVGHSGRGQVGVCSRMCDLCSEQGITSSSSDIAPTTTHPW